MSGTESSNYRVEYCDESNGWTVRDGDLHVATFAREQDAGDYLAHFTVIQAQHEEIAQLRAAHEPRTDHAALAIEIAEAIVHDQPERDVELITAVLDRHASRPAPPPAEDRAELIRRLENISSYDESDAWDVICDAIKELRRPEPPAEPRIDEIMSKLYRRFKEWSQRGFGPDDVTWCEVKADVLAIVRAQVPPPATLPSAHDVWVRCGNVKSDDVRTVMRAIMDLQRAPPTKGAV